MKTACLCHAMIRATQEEMMSHGQGSSQVMNGKGEATDNKKRQMMNNR
jgi:hypothetical protein